MKPDWKDAPEWARWLAMDGSGEWWWFEESPKWRAYGMDWEPIRGDFRLASCGIHPGKSLEPRP